MKPEYLIAARDQFKAAQASLVMAVRALQMSGYGFAPTIEETKKVIGDLAVTVEEFNDHIIQPKG